MPNEVTSADTIRALFVSAFPQHLTMKTLESPSVAIYIKDDIRNMYYELTDVRCVSCTIGSLFIVRLQWPGCYFFCMTYNESKKRHMQCTTCQIMLDIAKHYHRHSLLQCGCFLSAENCRQCLILSTFKLLGDSLFHTLLFTGLRLSNKSEGIERECDQSVFLCVCVSYLAEDGLGFLTGFIVMRWELVLTRF